MSSFGTQKPFGQEAVQLTFPTVFADAVAGHMPSAYYPEMPCHGVDLPEAHDLQGVYHRQKTMDAHRMAMAKVQSTVNSDRYAHQHHQNYATPKPLLTQRVYANPSNGNISDIYSARRVSFEAEPGIWSDYRGGLSGGVLYTKEAQKWGRQQLRNRIGQLDAIDAEKQGLQLQQAPSQEAIGSESENTKVKLEISQTLQAINASVNAGQANNFAFSDSIKFLRLLFRWAASASKDELMEVKEYCESIEISLRELLSSGEDGLDANENWVKKQTPQAEVMLDTFNRVNKYLDGMIGATVSEKVEHIDPETGLKTYTEAVGERDMTQKTFNERKKLSATLVKSLGFTTLLDKNQSAEALGHRAEELSKRQKILEAQQAGLPNDAFDDDDDDSFPDQWSNYGRRPSRVNSVIHGQLSGKMEQFQRDLDNADWSRQPREDMAYRRGTSFFGEEPNLANDVEEARLHNDFRNQDAGEAQAQGLEEGAQEVNPFDLPPVDYRPRSRRSGATTPHSGAITPRSGRSGRSSEAPAQPAVSAPVRMIRVLRNGQRVDMPYDDYVAEREEAKRQHIARLPPFPYTINDLYNTTSARIITVARDLKRMGFGTYAPRDHSEVKNVRKQLLNAYPQFRQ